MSMSPSKFMSVLGSKLYWPPLSKSFKLSISSCIMSRCPDNSFGNTIELADPTLAGMGFSFIYLSKILLLADSVSAEEEGEGEEEVLAIDDMSDIKWLSTRLLRSVLSREDPKISTVLSVKTFIGSVLLASCSVTVLLIASCPGLRDTRGEV